MVPSKSTNSSSATVILVIGGDKVRSLSDTVDSSLWMMLSERIAHSPTRRFVKRPKSPSYTISSFCSWICWNPIQCGHALFWSWRLSFFSSSSLLWRSRWKTLRCLPYLWFPISRFPPSPSLLANPVFREICMLSLHLHISHLWCLQVRLLDMPTLTLEYSKQFLLETEWTSHPTYKAICVYRNVWSNKDWFPPSSHNHFLPIISVE